MGKRENNELWSNFYQEDIISVQMLLTVILKLVLLGLILKESDIYLSFEIPVSVTA